jgi:hypothetical protein
VIEDVLVGIGGVGIEDEIEVGVGSGCTFDSGAMPSCKLARRR